MKKRLENLTKPNAQLFGDYLSIIKASKSEKWLKETQRLLGQFQQFLGEFPPTLELFTKFFERYSSREIRLSTRNRYYYVFSAFFTWYDGSSLPFKVKSPKPVPQKVSDEEVDTLKAAIRGRKTHKELIERDILIIDSYYNTGTRLADLANLRVRDLHLSGMSPYLTVLQGKGGKDRNVNLNPFICSCLKAFTRGMPPEASVFGIASKSIQSMVRNWAIKAGVPQLHPHSFRHKFATDIINMGGSLRDVQHLLGHESLATTETYLAVTDESLSKTVGLLDGSTLKEQSPETKEVTQRLDHLNESMDDIKKHLDENSLNGTGVFLRRDENGGVDDARLRQQQPGETEHTKMIRGLARDLSERIRLPSLLEKDLWTSVPLHFGPGSYDLSFGGLAIGRDGKMKVHYAEPRPALAPPYLRDSLYTHLSTSPHRYSELVGEAGSIQKWGCAVERYLAEAMELLKTVVARSQGQGVRLNEDHLPLPGLTRSFALTIWYDALCVAAGQPWIDDSWYHTPIGLQDGNLWQLHCGAYVIGVASVQAVLSKYEADHKALRKEFAKDAATLRIAGKVKDLEMESQNIGQRLLEFSDTGTLPGCCALE